MSALPAFVPSIDSSMRQRIEEQLAQIEKEENIRILFAVESGSRAWGHPSPDSDYDVRFVYTHSLDWYLSLTPGRDVIERPIIDELDTGGWDLRKAMNLLLKPNVVLMEWLLSPIRYRWDEDACEKLIGFARKSSHKNSCRWHYLRLGERQMYRNLQAEEVISAKKYFYVLRPALALLWIRDRDDLPPMNIQELVSGLSLAENQIEAIVNLIEEKAKLKETDAGQRHPIIDFLIEEAFEWARNVEIPKPESSLEDEGNALFRALIKSGQ